jgi:hypothetical protein
MRAPPARRKGLGQKLDKGLVLAPEKASFLVCLGLLEYLVFSDCFSLFFQGDAQFYMAHRFRSWGEYFQALHSLDVANWYRPLASQTIPSLFFPWFGLDPYGYHWIVFILFFLTTCAAFLFLQQLTGRFVVAATGTLFFSIHSINVYVTYDFAYAPELLYASFYLLSCVAYLRGADSHPWYILSLLFFVLALMSKEAAVTLPGNILLLTLLFGTDRNPKRLLPFLAVFALYYFYIVRFLKVGAGDYALAIHNGLLPRLQDSFLLAFNLRRGYMAYTVAIAALFVAAYAIGSLCGSRRRYTLFGLSWFLIALSPMLGIVKFFETYYLFLPLIGIALIAGESFAWLHAGIARFSPRVAFAVVCLGLTPFVVSARVNAQAELLAVTALGFGGRVAENAARALKRSHPAMQKGATIYIINPDRPDLMRLFGISSLFKLVYDDDTIDVRYSSLGQTIPEDALKSSKLAVMRYENESLVPADASTKIPWQYEQDFDYDTSREFNFSIFPAQIAAGSGTYTIQIAGSENSVAELQYRFNEGPLAFITVHLNPNGETRFFVSNETKRGIYRFVGMRIVPSSTWLKAAGSITVTD